jgi:D-lactate dehydrogenase
MQVAVFSTKPYDRRYLTEANRQAAHEMRFFEPRLTVDTAPLADGSPAVCIFVNDLADAPTLEGLARSGTRLLALRSAGFNHVDLEAAERLGITVTRVPAYSPHAVAEFTVGMILTLARKYHRAHNRVREGNFALEGLLGFDLHSRSAGIVGTGKIGYHVASILAGFGCVLYGYDPHPNPAVEALGVTYLELDELLARSEIITLHTPLTPDTHHLIDRRALELVRPGAMLINTSRGALIDTEAVIEALKDGRLEHLGLDVYEEEGDLFFEDLSNRVIQDDVFTRLLTFPNVLITGHQAFFTAEALAEIAATTVANITAFAEGRNSGNELELRHTRG